MAWWRLDDSYGISFISKEQIKSALETYIYKAAQMDLPQTMKPIVFFSKVFSAFSVSFHVVAHL